MNWPFWWNWELEITPHVVKRMLQRNFNEVDLRSMFSNAKSIKNDVVPGRHIIDSNHQNSKWQIIIEPDFEEHLIVVITAYKIED